MVLHVGQVPMLVYIYIYIIYLAMRTDMMVKEEQVERMGCSLQEVASLLSES